MPQDQATKTCNCTKKDECPLKGTCLSEGVIYQATVTSLVLDELDKERCE